MVAHIVVEVCPPVVNTLYAGVGDALAPAGGGYDVANLHAVVVAGLAKEALHGSSRLVEIGLAHHLALAGELGVQFHLEALEVEISFHYAAGLQGQGILHIEVAAQHGTVEIDVGGENITFHYSLLTHHDAGFRVQTALEGTIDTYIVYRCDITGELGAGSDAVDIIYIYSVCHNRVICLGFYY